MKTSLKERNLEAVKKYQAKQKDAWTTNYAINPEYTQNKNLMRKFGITLDDYDTMLFKQKGRCAICGIHHTEVPKRFNVDHDHNTGKVRGLLCLLCNTALGKFKDDINLLQNAIKYLKNNG